jgi:hypothetical protein
MARMRAVRLEKKVADEKHLLDSLGIIDSLEE